MRVTFVVGLPGSGKTRLLERFAAAGAVTVDDPTSLDELPSEPVEHLVVADAHLCRQDARTPAEAVIRHRYQGVKIDWVFFANEPARCRLNAECRDDGRAVGADIDTLSRVYAIPEGIVPLPVYTSEEAS